MRLTKVSCVVISIFSVLIVIAINNSVAFKCFTYMTSTCRNDVITKWNKNNIGENLKQWVKSVSIEKIDEKTAELWSQTQDYHKGGKHCKTITTRWNDVFPDTDPELYSPNITILGKVTHRDDGKKLEPRQRKFIGPIWATINDQYEWYIDDKEGQTSGLSNGSKLHNGFYYGILNNEHMKVGYSPCKDEEWCEPAESNCESDYVKKKCRKYCEKHLNAMCNETEKNMVFIYPDMKTVLVGKFEDGIMLSGRPAKIVAERCNDGIKEIKLSAVKPDAPTFKYSRPTRVNIGDRPNEMDPYERKFVYINTTKWGDDGLFAKKDIKENELVSYYSGIIFDVSEIELFPNNQTGYEMYIVHKNLIGFSTYYSNVHINIPQEYWSIVQYRATLTHKINHSFKKANVHFGSAIHPRYGPIRTAVAKKDIKKGEEILVDYGYGKDSAIPRWFEQAYIEELGKPWPGNAFYNETNDVDKYQ